ncbi:MAG: MBL fold metallo-hydrolase [Chloroflexi bacterium]|nr:MBL fold metallo-hydrolase [Chloroflexota bacterium]
MSEQPRGVYPIKVGQLECLIISDMQLPVEPGADLEQVGRIFSTVPLEDLKPAVDWQMQRVDTTKLFFNCMLIKSGERHILVDAGYGPGVRDDLGLLLPRLAEQGIAAEQIDTLVLTHGHGDHFLGLANDDGDLTFPKARHIMWKSEWEHWTAKSTLAEMADDRADRIVKRLLPIQSKLTLVDEETEIAPGVTVMSLPGHTPGHIGLMLESEGERLLNLLDSVHYILQLQHLDWPPLMDSLPEQASATRKMILQRAVDEDLLTLVFHFPFPGLGKFVAEGEGYGWKPLA